MTNPNETAIVRTTIHARVIEADPVVERPATTRQALYQLPAGRPLVQSAALVAGLAVAPLLLDRLQYDAFRIASATARAVAPPWPSGSEPVLWSPTVAMVALATGALVLVVAVLGTRLPTAVPLVLAAVLTGTTAVAAWSTLDVVNAQAWVLLPACALGLLAFVVAARALLIARRTGVGTSKGSPVSGTLLAWGLVLAVLVGGTAIATAAVNSSTAEAASSSTAPSLDGVRSEGAAALDGIRGAWVPQVASAQIYDESAANAYLTKHQEWTGRFPVILVRGGDFPTSKLGAEDWMTLVVSPLGTEAEVQNWCTANALGPDDCLPRHIPAG